MGHARHGTYPGGPLAAETPLTIASPWGRDTFVEQHVTGPLRAEHPQFFQFNRPVVTVKQFFRPNGGESCTDGRGSDSR